MSVLRSLDRLEVEVAGRPGSSVVMSGLNTVGNWLDMVKGGTKSGEIRRLL